MRTFFLSFALLASVAAWPQWTELSPAVDHLSLHHRVSIGKNASFGIEIAHSDTAGNIKVEVKTPSQWADDITGALPVKVDITEDGAVRESKTVPLFVNGKNLAELSIKVVGQSANALIEIGDSRVRFEHPVALSDSTPLFVRFFNENCDAVLRRDCDFKPQQPVRHSRFTSKSELEDYLAASDDPYESLWTFYDRTSNPLVADASSQYILATVKSSDGYDLIFLDDLNGASRNWKPLSIKGVLHSTDIPGVFDVTWHERSKSTVDSPVNAVIEAPFMTVNFPYYKTSLRFAMKRMK